MEFLAMMKEAGFNGAELVSETGMDSSPKTRGVVIRAVKPFKVGTASAREGVMEKYREFFEAAYTEGALDRKMKHLVALGASLGAGCEP